MSRKAPVKLPRTWPKSSDSSRVSGIPAQLMADRDACRRALCWCSSRATTSLPTPVSPVMSTFASDRAAVSMSAITCRVAALAPTNDTDS